jgi:RND superfamily putative drug exporter
MIDRPDDGLVGVTGAAPARVEQVRLITGALTWLHIATVLVIGLVLGLHFRSLLAPIVTLVAVGLSFLVAIRAVGWVGSLTGYSLPQELEPLIIVLLLGVVTDYAIFYLAAYRRELRRGMSPGEALVRATAGVTPIVVVAALVVAAGTATLVVSRLDFFRVLGPGLAITVLSGLIVSVTLLPALLAALGRAALWPASPGRGGPRRIDRRRFRRLHPGSSVRAAAVSLPLIVVLLAALGVGAGRIDLGLPVVDDLPADSEPARAAAAAEEGIAAGVLSPTILLLEQAGIAVRQAQLASLQTELEAVPGVVGVVGPREQPVGVPVGAVYAADGSAARIAVVLDADPTSAAGIALVRTLRDRLPAALQSAGLEGVRVSLGGNSALALETVDAISDDLWRVALVAAGVNLALLLLFLRGAVAAVGLLAASVLGLAAALGVTELVFLGWLGHGELTYYVPFAVAVLLLSLGSDYTIFIAGRIWQEARTRPLRDALHDAGREASGPITVAGLALALSFALLAVVPLNSFRELALAMAVGVLLDAFVVRTLLVPALINVLGERARWPGRPRTAARHAAPRNRTGEGA